MATAPVLVRHPTQSLPPVASFAFADILRTADGPELQKAIDGIAEIAAKNRMSLADEYASHMPPLGTITATNSSIVRTQLGRPGMRRALTSVPEASSGSSEDSHRSKKQRTGLFSFKREQAVQSNPLRVIRIGSMGRTISVGSTIALTTALQDAPDTVFDAAGVDSPPRAGTTASRRPSDAASSLQRLLGQNQQLQNG
ncbi:uncharacterized protein LTR77_008136 [Saxophila tyrrhenica]|uniref:Uncharacterized protein n=1 Tax=Saxophila tyrrhenica TaxID=1690608 RepID=A0AAV9P1Y6_9PEZI|nr:hypothetical protein LTR77_008136 [Saxophila tyrrhenica]